MALTDFPDEISPFPDAGNSLPDHHHHSLPTTGFRSPVQKLRPVRSNGDSSGSLGLEVLGRSEGKGKQVVVAQSAVEVCRSGSQGLGQGQGRMEICDSPETGGGGGRWLEGEVPALLKIGLELYYSEGANPKEPYWETISMKLGEMGYKRDAKTCQEKLENIYKYHRITKERMREGGLNRQKVLKFFDEFEVWENQNNGTSILGTESSENVRSQSREPLEALNKLVSAQTSLSNQSSENSMSGTNKSENFRIESTDLLEVNDNSSVKLLETVGRFQSPELIAVQNKLAGAQMSLNDQSNGNLNAGIKLCQDVSIGSPDLMEIANKFLGAQTSLIDQNNESLNSGTKLLENDRIQSHELMIIPNKVVNAQTSSNNQNNGNTSSGTILLENARIQSPKPVEIPNKLVDAQTFLNEVTAMVSSCADAEMRDGFEVKDLAEADNRKRKRKSSKKLEKFKPYLGTLVEEVMKKQEQMYKQFMEILDKKEKERVIREEAWRRQDMERQEREMEMRAQENSRTSAIIAFINTVSGEQQISIPESPRHEDQELKSDSNNKRWPDPEVKALITLRTLMEPKSRSGSSKPSLWEDISLGMSSIGYSRSAKKCKEKWDNMNKYFRRSLESGKKRPESAKTCQYFHELSTWYKNGNTDLVIASDEVKSDGDGEGRSTDQILESAGVSNLISMSKTLEAKKVQSDSTCDSTKSSNL